VATRLRIAVRSLAQLTCRTGDIHFRIEAHWQLGGAALLLARDPDDGVDVEPLIQEALAAAATQGIYGQGVTPFVLSFLHERSEGRTLEVNRALIVANARLAAEVAVAASG